MGLNAPFVNTSLYRYLALRYRTLTDMETYPSVEGPHRPDMSPYR